MKPEWVLAGLIALIFWLPGPIDHFWEIRVSFYETAKLVRYLSLLDFILIVSLFISPKSKYSRFRKIDLFVGVLLFFLIILSLINLIWHFQFLDPVRKPALLTGLIFLRIFIVFFIVQKSVNLSVDLIKIYIGVILGTLGLIVNSGYKYFTGENMIGRLIAGTFGNNIFGVLLAIMAIMIESYKNFVHSKSLRVFLTIVQLICLTFIILTGTRMALVTIAIGILVFVSIRRRRFSKKLVQLMGFAIIFILILVVSIQVASVTSISGVDRVIELINVISGNSSNSNYELLFGTLGVRIIFWDFALDRLSASPLFGIGPGQWNFERSFGTSHHLFAPNGVIDSVIDPHNGYVLIAVEYGWISIIAYLLILIICVSSGWRTLTLVRKLSTRDPEFQKINYLIAGIFVSVLMILIGELTNSYIASIHLQLFFGILLFSLLRSRAVLRNELDFVSENSQNQIKIDGS